MEQTIFQIGVVKSLWLAAAMAVVTTGGFLNDNARTDRDEEGRNTESMGAGESVSMLLWKKSARSQMMYSLKQAARETLARCAKALLATIRDEANNLFMWSRYFVIGQPHQELTPWCGWLRGVQERHLAWEIAWPDEDHLHP